MTDNLETAAAVSEEERRQLNEPPPDREIGSYDVPVRGGGEPKALPYLSREYRVRRMNEIFGPGQWNAEISELRDRIGGDGALEVGASCRVFVRGREIAADFARVRFDPEGEGLERGALVDGDLMWRERARSAAFARATQVLGRALGLGLLPPGSADCADGDAHPGAAGTPANVTLLDDVRGHDGDPERPETPEPPEPAPVARQEQPAPPVPQPAPAAPRTARPRSGAPAPRPSRAAQEGNGGRRQPRQARLAQSGDPVRQESFRSLLDLFKARARKDDPEGSDGRVTSSASALLRDAAHARFGRSPSDLSTEEMNAFANEEMERERDRAAGAGA